MTQNKLVYRPTPTESLSETVIRGVADANDVDPIDLDERLYDCIDPDALDRLFDPTGQGDDDRLGTVIFSMAGCRVEVESTRTVIVKPTRTVPSASRVSA